MEILKLKLLGISPKKVSIVVTGKFKSCTSKVIKIIEINEPGIFVVIFLENIVIKIEYQQIHFVSQ